jgi:hypothetical protein
MGDRASIIFFDDRVISPTVYLHWHGPYIPEWLEILEIVMTDRTGDAMYAAARFVGICHERIEGNLSLCQAPENVSSFDRSEFRYTQIV